MLRDTVVFLKVKIPHQDPPVNLRATLVKSKAEYKFKSQKKVIMNLIILCLLRF